MGVEITKVGEKYEARVLDAGGEETWRTAAPMEMDELRHSLSAEGCHPIDIHDAFFQAEWPHLKPDVRNAYTEWTQALGKLQAEIDSSGIHRKRRWIWPSSLGKRARTEKNSPIYAELEQKHKALVELGELPAGLLPEEWPEKTKKSNRWTIIVALPTAIGIAVGCFALFAAIQHNPQGETIDTVTGRIHFGYLILLFVSWFIPVSLAAGIVIFLVCWGWKKVRLNF